MSKIIVPVDGSQIADKALEFAISMAKAYGDEIRLLNIQPNLQILGEGIIKDAAATLEREQISYTSTIRVGTPAMEIITEAKDKDVRCIVMGTKGSGNAVSGKLGSVSQATLSMAPCPILFIPV
ncbi:MAG TPA: universal stress protein [Bacillus bacterium]|nr:universal stress protein [Bacillus sp. (in: firmicutes)]